MAININELIPVTSGIQNPPQGAGILAGLMLTTNTLIPTTSPVLRFSSLDLVGEFFGTTSNEYLVATNYFNGWDEAITQPSYLYFGLFPTSALAPYLRSATVANQAILLQQLSGITSGNLTVSSDGVTYSASKINLSTATSLSQVASLLETAIVTANPTLTSFTITFSGITNTFNLTNGVTGSLSTMGYCTAGASPDIATILGLTQSTGAILSQGQDAQTPAQNLAILQKYWQDTSLIFTVDDLGDTTEATFLAIAQWINQNTNNTVGFLAFDNETATTQSNDTTSLVYQINQLELNNTAVVYNTPNICAFISGCFAGQDYSAVGTAISVAWKSQQGLAYSVNDNDIATILTSKGVNFYGDYTLNNGNTQAFSLLQPGSICGVWGYIDNLLASAWIGRSIQVSLAQLFNGATQITGGTAGQEMIFQNIDNVMQTMLPAEKGGNGIIALGLTFDKATQQQYQAQYGININVVLTNNGYAIIPGVQTSEQRAKRVGAIWTVLYAKGSAINVLPISTIAMI